MAVLSQQSYRQWRMVTSYQRMESSLCFQTWTLDSLSYPRRKILTSNDVKLYLCDLDLCLRILKNICCQSSPAKPYLLIKQSGDIVWLLVSSAGMTSSMYCQTDWLLKQDKWSWMKSIKLNTRSILNPRRWNSWAWRGTS